MTSGTIPFYPAAVRNIFSRKAFYRKIAIQRKTIFFPHLICSLRQHIFFR